MTEGGISNPNPNPTDDGRPNPNRPTELAQLDIPLGFFWTEYGRVPTADQLFGLFSSLSKRPYPPGLKVSYTFLVELDEDARNNFELICEENFVKGSLKIRCQENFVKDSLKIDIVHNDANNDFEPARAESVIVPDFELACDELFVDFFRYPARVGYHVYPTIMSKVFPFSSDYPPPATILFISGNRNFAPFLVQLKKKGYNVITIGRSEDASSAFVKAGLVLYDWGPASRGEGFFPIGV